MSDESAKSNHQKLFSFFKNHDYWAFYMEYIPIQNESFSDELPESEKDREKFIQEITELMYHEKSIFLYLHLH